MAPPASYASAAGAVLLVATAFGVSVWLPSHPADLPMPMTIRGYNVAHWLFLMACFSGAVACLTGSAGFAQAAASDRAFQWTMYGSISSVIAPLAGVCAALMAGVLGVESLRARRNPGTATASRPDP